MFAVAFVLLACEGEDLSKVDKTGGNGNVATGENRNANNASTYKEYRRLEFPQLKTGANRVLLHKTKDGVLNFAVEWNEAEKAQSVISRTQTNTLWTLCYPSRYGLPLIPTGVLVTIMGISVRRQTDLIRMKPIIKLFISPTCSPSCLDLTELYGKPWKQRCARLLVAMVIRFAIHFIFAKEAR